MSPNMCLRGGFSIYVFFQNGSSKIVQDGIKKALEESNNDLSKTEIVSK